MTKNTKRLARSSMLRYPPDLLAVGFQYILPALIAAVDSILRQTGVMVRLVCRDISADKIHSSHYL